MPRGLSLCVGLLLGLAALSTAAAAAAEVDWPTYGFSPVRTGRNPFEHRLGPHQARSLREAWSADLGGLIDTQPVLASGLRLSDGSTRDLVYAGTEGGRLIALDAATGSPVWSPDLGALNVP